jgi:hypothetical protein
LFHPFSLSFLSSQSLLHVGLKWASQLICPIILVSEFGLYNSKWTLLFFRVFYFILHIRGPLLSRCNVPQTCVLFPTAFHSFLHSYNNCPATSGIPHWATVYPGVLKTRFFYWLWRPSIHLHITYVATLGLTNQDVFDAISVWFSRHIYLENEPVNPSGHALIYWHFFFLEHICGVICLQGNLGMVSLYVICPHFLVGKMCKVKNLLKKVKKRFWPYHGVQKRGLVNQQSSISGGPSIFVTNNIPR